MKWPYLENLNEWKRIGLSIGIFLLALLVGTFLLAVFGVLSHAAAYSGLGVGAIAVVFLFALIIAFGVWFRTANGNVRGKSIQSTKGNKEPDEPYMPAFNPDGVEFIPASPPIDQLDPLVSENMFEIKNRISHFLIEKKFKKAEQLLKLLESTGNEELCQWSALQRRYINLNR